MKQNHLQTSTVRKNCGNLRYYSFSEWFLPFFVVLHQQLCQQGRTHELSVLCTMQHLCLKVLPAITKHFNLWLSRLWVHVSLCIICFRNGLLQQQGRCEDGLGYFLNFFNWIFQILSDCAVRHTVEFLCLPHLLHVSWVVEKFSVHIPECKAMGCCFSSLRIKCISLNLFFWGIPADALPGYVLQVSWHIFSSVNCQNSTVCLNPRKITGQ